ncbi:MAG: four helix bundle protein [Chloroflexaceae bacterium]|jgi:four helix bundle protein|nr:four helix bundle protein [Chloroflexaceae bacterium]
MPTYQEWEQNVPTRVTGDPLWKMRVYRLALFLSDIGWVDVSKLAQDARTKTLADQLYTALGSIGANLAEGYSRSSGKDRVRFYEYALGSARESREWYYRGRHVLEPSVVEHRIDVLAEIIRLFLAIIPEERNRQIREESATYTWNTAENDTSIAENDPQG